VTDAGPGPRVPPLPRSSWDDSVRDAVRSAFPGDVADRFLSDGPDAMALPNAIGMFLHHPALAGRWLAYNNVLLWDGTLDARLRELVVLRVGWLTRSRYEWAQHVRLGARFGVTADDVDAIARDAHGAAWSELERAAVDAADQLVGDHRVDDATWSRLAAHLDQRQLVELLFVVGTYTCLAMVFNATGVALDPGSDLPPGAPTLPE
jgi:4-carboxymuconolactone decarboxylase